ncbi:DUF3320 domain-containing protein [uncultured Microbacterium sp.]|uniref:DUF3320 domain-containing protein n=1 Tax=uncultured Microbacterium sp. TaxID=191216 RepID=UPI0028E3F843|nr:DUF3320 domain-containing protein [uncultured Microbacterium sp.]
MTDELIDMHTSAAPRPSKVRISLECREVVSFVAAYNRRPLIYALAVSSVDGARYEDVRITVELTSLGVALTESWRRAVTAIGPVATEWTGADFHDLAIDANVMLQMRERRFAEYTVTVVQGDEVLGTTSRRIDLLASDTWAATSPLADSARDLAAFVQMREPALRPVLVEAAQLLKSRTGSDALEGYQSVDGGEPGRVGAIVESLYDAVRARRIGYIDPPPSWDIHGTSGGQNVRLSAEVLSEGFGTCLDTTVLFASLLAAVGLNPVIFLIPGHAFVGYWTRDEFGRRDAVWPATEAYSPIDAGALVVIETTRLTSDAPFEVSLREARQRLDDVAALPAAQRDDAWAVDIRAARVSGIRQIPSRVVAADGSVTLVEHREAAIVASDITGSLAPQRGGGATLSASNAPARVKSWQDSLLDLSLRNPLLNYKWPIGRSASLMVPSGFLGAVEDLLQSGRKLRLQPNTVTSNGREVQLAGRRTVDSSVADALASELAGNNTLFTDIPADSFLTRMRRIATNARSIIDETGSNGLYLALGTVVWKAVKSGVGEADVFAPLILVPVNLRTQNRSREFLLEIDAGSAVTPNFSLAEKLKQEFRLDLPKLVEPDLDDAGIDIDGLIGYVRQEFIKAGLTDFRVDENCTLGFFDFSTYRMWRDLRDNWPTFLQSPLVSHLVESPLDAFVDPAAGADDDDEHPAALDDFAASLPVLSDGSQAMAVHRAMNGHTFVLQGPPGTGKSQTITNMLARALHSGKRVLFVAEKAGALGVVRDRLAAVGLGAFGLNLHDKGMRPADVRAQLSEALDAAARADRAGYGAAQHDIDRSMVPLRRYPERLHARGALGESVYSARNELLARAGQSVSILIPRSFLSQATPDAVDDLKRRLRDAADLGSIAGTVQTNPWSLARLRPDELDARRRDAVVAAVGALHRSLDAAQRSGAVDRWLLDVREAADLWALRSVDAVPLPLAVIDAAADPAAREARANVERDLPRYDPAALFPGASPESLRAPVAELRTAADAAAASFFLGRKKRIALVCRRVEEYLAPGTVVGPDALTQMLGELERLQSSAAGFAAYVRALPGVVLAPQINVLQAEDRADIASQLARVDADVERFVGPTPTHARLRDLAAMATHDDWSLITAVARDFSAVCAALGADAASTAAWSSTEGLVPKLRASLDRWTADAADRDLLLLRRWTELWGVLAPLVTAGLGDAVAEILNGRVPYPDAERAFELGFYTALLDQQLDSEGLDAFDGRRQDAEAHLFASSAQALRALSPGVLADDMIRNRGFDAGVNIGAVGELRRELSKTRGFKQIRRLLADHWHVISKVTPCVLAVPDALVRFLDPTVDPFDLVIFDEASQIKVPHAIGALGRAKAAVIVGDSKQMPPTSVAQVTLADDEMVEEGAAEPETVRDEESILSECTNALVPDMMLSWHYRSADESLIAFSNQEYYDGKLSTFPGPQRGAGPRAVRFEYVDGGTFARRGGSFGRETGTNRLEAERIVAEITRHVNDPVRRVQSIGVVTFNKPQQDLVQSLLAASEDAEVQRALNADETAEAIKVWNLETVQGHERDVILFSVAFSKDDRGVIPRNFGPLTQVGGQRRLNVAVTRARREVIVFCSFRPNELNVEGVTHDGLRHLHAYLRLAQDGPDASGALSSREIVAPDRHRQEIVDALRERGMDAAAEVGLSRFKVDIGVSAPDASHFAVGILLDGPTWHSRATVGDRDALPVTLLHDRMGWPEVIRIWLPDWLRDREAELDRVAEALARAGDLRAVSESVTSPGPVSVASTPATAPPSAAPRDAAVETPSPREAPPTRASLRAQAAPRDPLAGVPFWRAWDVEIVGPEWVLDQLAHAPTQEHIRSLAQRIAAVEGPIHPTRLAKLIAQAHGLQRVAAKRVAAIDEVVRSTFSLSADGFLFAPADGPLTYGAWARSDPGQGRVIDEVSYRELGNAMRDIARIGLGATRDDLIRSTAPMFGVARLTVGIRDRLSSALDHAIEHDVLRETGGYIVAGS